MIRINRKLDNKFLSNNEDDSYSYKKAIDKDKKIDYKTSEKSSSYTLENTEYYKEN